MITLGARSRGGRSKEEFKSVRLQCLSCAATMKLSCVSGIFKHRALHPSITSALWQCWPPTASSNFSFAYYSQLETSFVTKLTLQFVIILRRQSQFNWSCFIPDCVNTDRLWYLLQHLHSCQQLSFIFYEQSSLSKPHFLWIGMSEKWTFWILPYAEINWRWQVLCQKMDWF